MTQLARSEVPRVENQTCLGIAPAFLRHLAKDALCRIEADFQAGCMGAIMIASDDSLKNPRYQGESSPFYEGYDRQRPRGILLR